jgi:hypothetical protein
MKLPSSIDAICIAAIVVWGRETQEAMAIGEIGELLALFGRRAQRRDTKEQWIDEIADGIIMLHQLAITHGLEDVEKRIAEKLVKLQARVDNY